MAIANVNDRPDLYRLTGDPSHHWIELKLVGTTSNRDAIGARVHIVAAGTEQWQEVRGGGSYLSQNDLRVHFGLAGATVVDRLDVRWPNGRDEHWDHLPADKLHTLHEGTGTSSALQPAVAGAIMDRHGRAGQSSKFSAREARQ